MQEVQGSSQGRGDTPSSSPSAPSRAVERVFTPWERELLEALADLRRVCADIPAVEGNPKFAAANQRALAAIAKATGAA